MSTTTTAPATWPDSGPPAERESGPAQGIKELGLRVPVTPIQGIHLQSRLESFSHGNMAPDWEIQDDLSVLLRAERNGTGAGRTYTLGLECSDENGNVAEGTTVVTVPHSPQP